MESKKTGGNRTGNKMVFKHTSKFQLELFKITVLWMVFKTEEVKKNLFGKVLVIYPLVVFSQK